MLGTLSFLLKKVLGALGSLKGPKLFFLGETLSHILNIFGF